MSDQCVVVNHNFLGGWVAGEKEKGRLGLPYISGVEVLCVFMPRLQVL